MNKLREKSMGCVFLVTALASIFAVIIICLFLFANGLPTIAEIGPCSNLALAVLKAPDIVPLIKRVIFMGGSFFKPGNVTPTAEFNWWFDPEAARIVVRTPFREQIMVGLDVCEKMPFSFDRYQAFLAGQRPEMKKLLESTYAG